MTRILLCAAVALALVGCGVPETVKTQAVLNEVRTARMVELIGTGGTTREQEQEFIRVEAAAWKTFREALGLQPAGN